MAPLADPQAQPDAFLLRDLGEVSPVITGPKGVFLVRIMAVKPPMTSSFEAVWNLLEREEQARLKTELEQEFQRDIQSRHPAAVR